MVMAAMREHICNGNPQAGHFAQRLEKAGKSTL